jgi:hypothetical protein
MANKDSLLAMLETRERSELGSIGLMLAKESQARTAMGLDDEEYESLRGPRAPFMYIDWDERDTAFVVESAEEIYTEKFNLKDWYFSRIDWHRKLMQRMRYWANQGYAMHNSDLFNIKMRLARLDSMAEDAGWDFFSHPKTAYQRLQKEFRLCKELTVETRMAAIQSEKESRAAYLVSIKEQQEVEVIA